MSGKICTASHITIVQHLIRFSQSDWSKAQDAELRNFGCCTPQACDIHPDCCTLVSHHNKRHNNCAAYYCGFARSSRAQKLFCEWNTRYALVARALAIFSHWGGKIKFYSIRGSLRDSYQLPSILLIFEVSYKTNVSLRAVQWQGFRIRWKIATHCSTQLRFVEQCVAIFHLMRNPWPSHGSAWNICILLRVCLYARSYKCSVTLAQCSLSFSGIGG